jgi:chemotaxis protein methyltransferase CheR
MITFTPNETEQLRAALVAVSGIDIPPEKSYLFQTRLAPGMQRIGFSGFRPLIDLVTVKRDPAAIQALVDVMVIPETSFFRDQCPFVILKNALLPQIAAAKVARGGLGPPRIRILSAACSTGQEVYSIAMTFAEWLETHREFSAANVSITAIDISQQSLKYAETGSYSAEEILRGLTPHQKAKYFTHDKNRWVVNPALRAMVNFAQANLNGDFEKLGTFDVIFCRNVLIYFSTDTARRIVSKFRRMLIAPGALIIGASESLYQISEQFTSVYAGECIYYQ